MARPRRRISIKYCVQEGAPSWHQQRAGHISAGGMCFWKKSEAQAFLRRVKKLRPNEPAFITTTRELRHFSGGGPFGRGLGSSVARVQQMWQVRGRRADGGKLAFPVMAFDITEAGHVAKKKARGGSITDIVLVDKTWRRR